MKLSIVSPVYKAEKTVEKLCARIIESIPSDFDTYEILLIDDCSPDKSWQKILELSQANEKITGIKLSRNFGQHYAIKAGLDESSGDWVVVMDCDLQDVPEEIPNLYEATKEGFPIILARREARQDTFSKRLFSKLFYKTLSFLTKIKMDGSVANFGIYSKEVINNVKQLNEPMMFFPTMVKFVGFESKGIEVKHSSRTEGESNYNYAKLFKLAQDIILANSEKPLIYIVRFGLTMAFLSFAVGIVTIIRYSMGLITEPGFLSTIVSVWFIGGMLMLTLGLLGLYIGKIFQTVKHRPNYIIQTKTN